MKRACAIGVGAIGLLAGWLGCNTIAGIEAPEEACKNGKKDGDETGIDCGGPHCPPCGGGQSCDDESDCPGGVCLGSTCCTPPAKDVICQGKCGPLTDECGIGVECDGCTLPETCAGGGVANVCGCQAPCPVWARGFVNKNAVVTSPANWPVAVAVAVAGDAVILAGSFPDTLDFGGPTLQCSGGTDVFVVKLDKDGAHVASRQSNGDGLHNDAPGGVAADNAGRALLTGSFAGAMDFGMGGLVSTGASRDVFVAKLGGTLVSEWSAQYGDGSSQSASGVAVDDVGNVVVVGTFGGVLDFFDGNPHDSGGALDNVFVARFNAAHQIVWSKGFSTGDGYGVQVAVDKSHNVILAGVLFGTIDFGGGPLISGAALNPFVVKLDQGGNHLWSERFGGGGGQFIAGVTADGTGNVLVMGSFGDTLDFGDGPVTSAGDDDIFVVKLDPTGKLLWKRRFGDGDRQVAAGLAVTPAGDVLIAGTFSGTIDLGGGQLVSKGLEDIFLARLDAGGNHVWSKRFGDTNAQFATGVGVDGAGNVVLSGTFPGVVAGTVDFGFGPITSNANNDGTIFVAKLKY